MQPRGISPRGLALSGPGRWRPPFAAPAAAPGGARRPSVSAPPASVRVTVAGRAAASAAFRAACIAAPVPSHAG